jgi:hypothetical protein
VPARKKAAAKYGGQLRRVVRNQLGLKEGAVRF